MRGVVGWFGNRKKGGVWDLEAAEPPWEGGRSICAHVREHIVPGRRGLAEGGERLPDEKDDGALKWVAGGLDGAFGHHAGGGGEKARAKMLHRALRVVVEDASAEKLRKLYALLLDGSALDCIDPLLEQLVERQDVDPARLRDLAVWIATKAPDREPVKFAIALLGVAGDRDQVELLSTLGRHEELTLYVAVALANIAGEDAEPILFDLAQQVDGWGRIQIVERLAGTRDPGIKAWMVREGYRNSVMYEYLAYTCATAGGLRAELEKESVDAELLRGAGEIIQALIAGGPAEDLGDYADGPVVIERYLHHLGPEPRSIEQLVVVDHILRFLDDPEDERARSGWTAASRERVRARAEAIRALPHWEALVRAGLASEDPVLFAAAVEGAKAAGIDAWDQHFSRLESGQGDGWYHVMQTEDPDRIARVVALAERVIPLEAIATGPAEELGLGPAWTDHNNLGWVLQDLQRFPGVGWSLIRAGIQSPVIRNRHMAVRALSTWGRAGWPPDAEAVLKKVRGLEPDADLRGKIDALLAGRPIEESGLTVEGAGGSDPA